MAPTLPKPHCTLSILTSMNAPPIRMDSPFCRRGWQSTPRQACGAPESRDVWAWHP